MRAALVATATALLLACGPDKADDTGATTDATTAVSSTAANTTSDATSTTANATTAAPTTAGPDCSQYADGELGPSVEITIRHDGADPIWLPASGCSGEPAVRVLDAADVDVFHTGGTCTSRRCVDLLQLESCEVACDPCAPPSLVRVDPGATIVVTWSAVRAEPLELTAECAPGAGCAGPCDRLVRVPDGTYAIELPAFLACTGDCECDAPDPDNFCSLFGVAEGGEPTTFTVTVDYAAETAVVITVP